MRAALLLFSRSQIRYDTSAPASLQTSWRLELLKVKWKFMMGATSLLDAYIYHQLSNRTQRQELWVLIEIRSLFNKISNIYNIK